MKLRFYLDLYPGQEFRYGYTASTQPFAKSDTVSRFAFDVEIPDELIYKPDVVSPETARAKKVE